MIPAKRLAADRWTARGLVALVFGVNLLLLVIALGLYLRSRPVLQTAGLSKILCGVEWYPSQEKFGLLGFIAGTAAVTLTAVVIAVSPCLLTAIYLSEYASSWMRRLAAPFVDLLAGIPSVVYGFWGVLMVVPLVRDRVAPLFGADTTGYCVLSAGIVLAVMIVPVLVHITLEVLRAVPNDLRNAALSLGATRWQMARGVLLRRCRAGIFSAVGIAVSRALGETMAVLMVAGNVWEVPRSAFDPCYPLPALIANNYGEILSIPRYEAAIMLAALVLFGVVVLFNAVSKAILMRIEEGVA